MELSLTTFILESVNFLVLIWILKRLFFIPIKRVIEERRAAVAQTLKDAQEKKNQADQLQTQYEGRLKAWEGEKEKAQEELQKSLAGEKSKRLKQIEDSLASERERMRAQEDKKAAEVKERMEREAIQQSLEFASRLFTDLASSDLETRIIKKTLERLQEQLSAVRGRPGKWDGACVVRTAFPLSEDQKKAIRSAIQTEVDSNIEFAVEFIVEKSLLAGIEIVLGSTVVRANLRDELVFFSEAKQP